MAAGRGSGRNDFYVEFGSNAKQFSRDLTEQLKGAQEAVGLMQDGLVLAVKRAERLKEAAQAAAAAADGGGSSGGGQQFDKAFFAEVQRAMASVVSDMSNAVTDIKTTVSALKMGGAKLSEAEKHKNRSQAAQDSLAARDRGDKGRFAPRGSTGIPASASNNSGASLAGQQSGKVSIAGTPTVVIQDATLSRIIAAIEAGNRETRATRVAAERIAARMRGGATRPGTSTASTAGAVRTERAERDSDGQSENSIKHQIAKRRRLNALNQELKRVEAGGAFDETLFKAAAGGSKKLTEIGASSGYKGDQYTARLERAISGLRSDLKGVPRISTLKKALAADPDAAGESAPRTSRRVRNEQAKAAREAKAEASASDSDKLKRLDDEIEKAAGLLGQIGGDAADAARAQLETMRAARAALAKEIAAAQKDAGMTFSQRKEQRRKEAAERRRQEGSLSPQQRRDTLTRLAAGGDESILRKMTQADLRKTAAAYQQEGYEIGFDPNATKAGGQRVTNERLIQAIMGANQSYVGNDRQTKNSLKVSDKVVATEVGPEAKRLVAAVARVVRRTTAEVAALELQELNWRTGGQSNIALAKGPSGAQRVLPNTTAADAMGLERAGRLGRAAKTISGRTLRGSAFGGAADEELARAERLEQEYRKRSGYSLMSRTLGFTRGMKGFDPYDPGVMGSIKGKGPEAEEARAHINALRRMTAAMDDTFQEYVRLDDELSSLNKSLDRVDREMTQIERSATQTPGDVERLNELRQQQRLMEQRHERTRGKRDDLMLAPNIPASEMDTPEYRSGVVARQASRDRMLEERERRDAAANEAIRNRQAVEGGLTDAAFSQRQRTHVGSGRNGPIDRSMFTQAVPGLRMTSRNGLQALDPSSVDPALLKRAQRQFRRLREFMVVASNASGDVSPEEMQKAAARAGEVLLQFKQTYERMSATAKGGPLGTMKFDLDDKGRPVYTNNEYDSARPPGERRPPQYQAFPEPAKFKNRTLDDIQGVLEGAPAPKISDRKGLMKLLGINPELVDRLKGGADSAARQKYTDMQNVRALGQRAPQEREIVNLVKQAVADMRKMGVGDINAKSDKDALARAIPALQSRLVGTAAEGRVSSAGELQDILSGTRMRSINQADLYAQDPQVEKTLAAVEKIFAEIEREAREAAPVLQEKARASRAKADQAEVEKFNAREDKRTRKREREEAAALAGGAEKPAKKGGGKGGGGKGGDTATPSSGEGGDKSLLARILARLDAIHASIRGGVVTRPAAGSAGGSSTTSTTPAAGRVAGSRAGKTSTATAQSKAEEAALRAAASQRRKEEEAERKEASTEGGKRNTQRTLSGLAVTYGRLSEQTRKYIAAMREAQVVARGANATDKDRAKVAEQQRLVYASMTRDLTSQGINTSGVRGAFKDVLNDPSIDKNQRVRVNESEINNISRQVNIQDPSLRRTGRGMGDQIGDEMGDGAMEAFSRTMFGSHGFWSRVMNSTGTFIVRNFTAGFVFGITNALQDVVAQAIETESTFVRVSHALEATGRSVGSLRTDLQDISTDYGIALVDVYETAAGLTGLFESTDEIAGATRVVAQLQMISKGALNAQEAMGALASISSAFNMTGVEGVEHIADVLTTIQNRLGVNLEVSAEGVGRLAGLANQIGLSFEETSVYVSEIAKRTNQTGAAAGEQFSRIIASMQSGRGQKALIEAFSDQGIEQSLSSGDYSRSIEILMENYQGLTKAQQDNLAVTLGGQRQAAALAALLKDGAGALDTITASQYSNGAATQRAAKISATLNAQLQRIQTNFVNLGAAMVQSGVLGFFNKLLEGTNLTLGGLNKILSVANQFAGENAFIGFLKNVATGALGALVAFRLLRASLAGFRQAVRSQSIAGAATRAFIGVPELDPNGQPSQGTPFRDRARAAGSRLSAAANTPITLGRDALRGLDPMAGPTTSMGRGLEAVTSGPLKRFGGALQQASVHLQNVSRNQATNPALQGTSGRTARLAETVGATGRGIGQLGYGAQAVWRGRGFEAAGGAMQRNSQRLFASAAGAAIGGAPMTARALGGMGTAAAASGRALTGVGTALRAVSMGGVAAQGALVGLSLAMTAVIMEMVRAEQFGRDVEDAYRARFTEEGRASEEEKAERYLGPHTELNKQNQRTLGGFSGYMRALGQTLSPANAFRGTDEIGSRAAGVLTDSAQDRINRLDTGIFASSHEMADRAREGLTSIEEVIEYQRKLLLDIDAEAAAISGNKDLSDEQKASGLASLEATAKYVENTTESIMAMTSGLGNLERMSTERINELQSLMNTFASAPTAYQNFQGAGEALMNQLGPAGTESGLTEAFATLTSGNATAAEVLQAQLVGQDRMISEATNRLNSATEPEDIDTRSQQLMGLLISADQTRRQLIDAKTTEATELATFMESRGDYEGAVDTLRSSADRLRSLVEASRAQRAVDESASARRPSSQQLFGKPGAQGPQGPAVSRANILDPSIELAYLNQADQQTYEATNKAVEEANRGDRRLAMQTRNSVGLAQLQLGMARRRVQMLKDSGGREEDILAAEEQAFAAGYALQDAEQARIQASYQARSAGILNAAGKARSDESGAWQAANHAKKAYGANSAEYLSALGAARSASQASTQAALDEAAAARDTLLAMIPPGDAVARAHQTLSNALAAQRDAARFGQSSAQYQQATQAVIEAQRGVSEAVNGITQANSNLAIALARAAGKTVDVARLQLDQAQRELQQARERSGGARSAEVINAEANVADANASLRDAALQDRMNTIDFQLQMEQITSRGAISMLTELLNMKDLTEEQRRSILLKIKQMEDELGSTMQGVFNLPENIKVPSVYEVRRAMGVDDYLKAMKDATSVSSITGPGTSSASANQILREIQQGMAKNGNSAVPVQTQDYSHSNNTVTINGASFDQVVDWLRENLGQGAQVVRSTSGRKGY